MRALVLAILLLAAPARAAERVTVAVLYFDNNSPDRQYDVLQKGLADMLVTDLSQVESLQVVERDKLQKLVDELKLQRSRCVRKQIAQIAAACQGSVMTAGFLSSAWQFGVQEALKAGDCDLYREIKGQAARVGGNVLDGIVRTAGNACGENLPEMNR